MQRKHLREARVHWPEHVEDDDDEDDDQQEGQRHHDGYDCHVVWQAVICRTERVTISKSFSSSFAQDPKRVSQHLRWVSVLDQVWRQISLPLENNFQITPWWKLIGLLMWYTGAYRLEGFDCSFQENPQMLRGQNSQTYYHLNTEKKMLFFWVRPVVSL